MKKRKQTKDRNNKIEQYFNQYTVEERLKIIADLIIDRILEKGNGSYGKLDQNK